MSTQSHVVFESLDSWLTKWSQPHIHQTQRKDQPDPNLALHWRKLHILYLWLWRLPPNLWWRSTKDGGNWEQLDQDLRSSTQSVGHLQIQHHTTCRTLHYYTWNRNCHSLYKQIVIYQANQTWRWKSIQLSSHRLSLN